MSQLQQVNKNEFLTPTRETVLTTGEFISSQSEDYQHPWASVRLLPDLRRYPVARFYNRQDVQDHIRVLKRFMPAAEFEIIFDVPSQVESESGIRLS